MTFSPRIRPLAALAAIVLVAPAVLARGDRDAAPQSHVRTKAAAKLVNLPDKNGLTIASVPADTLLAVYGERSGWLDVEPPQGLEVWVFGQYLRPAAKSGYAEVTGDDVRMRPKPASTTDSYALTQLLHKGDHVRVLGRADASKPLASDWVRVVSPPGVRAWIPSSETKALDGSTDVHAAWMAAVAKAQSEGSTYDLAGGKTATSDAAAAKKPQSAPASDASFDAAEALYQSAKAQKSGADWDAVHAAYQHYLDQNPTGTFAANAKSRIEEISVRQDIARIEADVAVRDRERQKELEAAQKRLKDVSLGQDPLWGRFQARGFLERKPIAGGGEVWVVNWGGNAMAEVTCQAGRYDLSVFEHSEVGVIGVTTRAGTAGGPLLPRIDARRIEVLSARAALAH